MNIRKVTSMTMFISFILLVLTSIILYIVPQGRVAYWADWHLWGMSKTEWANQHINLGFLFLFAGLLHIYYNWRPITAYMKNKARELKVFTPSFNVAMLLTLVVGFGTYFEIPPMSSVIKLGDVIKDSAAAKYGEPPYGHAELSSLKLFSKKQELDLDQALELLNKAGIQFGDSKDILAAIAAGNKMSPQDIYQIIKPAARKKTDAGAVAFPESPESGFGNMTLAAMCSEYNLMYQVIRRGLEEKNVKVDADMTIKEIAEASGKDPMAVFEDIRVLVNESR
ncbi:MAG: DUF4405 domain-containing protein [Desulfobulbaceae bacterium]|nr:DUF4405 domain-containing protein [Desulfobulbaceae bacterium]